MTNKEFVDKLLNIANNYKTIYAYGTWGQVLNNAIITSKTKQYPSWYTSSRQKMLRDLVGKGYFVFDCVGMIKAILWGWNGSNTTNGGAVYQSNGVPDLSANGMINTCNNISSNFSNIEMGEAVWMDGHIGVYWGNGQVIECSPAFKNKVQITKLSQRNWKKHGKLPWITYKQSFLPPKGYFTKGDSGKNVEKIDDWLSSLVVGDYYGYYTTEMVKALQAKGKEEGLYNDVIDGNWGAKTEALAEHYGFKP